MKKAAHDAVEAYFAKRLPQGQSLIDFAHGAKPDVDRFADAAKNGAEYRRRMTFSFSRDKAAGDAAMVVPKGPRFCWKHDFLSQCRRAPRGAVLHRHRGWLSAAR